MEVRPAHERDFEGIATVRLSNGAAHDDSGVSAEYCRHLVEHERLWVAVESGRVLAFGGGVQVGDARLLSDLFVHASAHGRGLGRAVLAEVLRGATDVFTFATDAPAALPLYMRAGMVPLHPVLTLEIESDRMAVGAPHAHLRTIDVEPADAVAFERAATGVDRSNTYEYWASRSRSRTIAVTESGEVRAVGAIRTGDDWVRIEHLTVAPSSSPTAGGEPAVSAIAADAALPNLILSVHGHSPLAQRLVRSGGSVVDLAVYMASTPSLVNDQVVVVHSGFG